MGYVFSVSCVNSVVKNNRSLNHGGHRDHGGNRTGSQLPTLCPPPLASVCLASKILSGRKDLLTALRPLHFALLNSYDEWFAAT